MVERSGESPMVDQVVGVSDWFVAVPAAKAIPLVDKETTTAARDARDKWQRRGSKDAAFVSPLIARRALGVTSSRHAPELSVDTTEPRLVTAPATDEEAINVGTVSAACGCAGSQPPTCLERIGRPALG